MKLSSAPLVSIIILNWNGYEDTVHCLESLLTISYPNYNVVVVDNGSMSNEAEKLQKKFGKYIYAQRLETNQGFTGGCNWGINFAKKFSPEYFLLLNNDTEVTRNFLDELVKVTEENKRIGLASPIIYDFTQRTKIVFSGGNINWLLAKFVHKTDLPDSTRIEKFITGCSMLIKKSVIEQIGLLDESFFAYFEDVAYCLKSGKNGYSCACAPQSKIYHKVSATSSKNNLLRTYLMSRNRILFVNSYTNSLFKAYFFLFNVLKLLFTLFYFTVSPQSKRAITYWKGFLDGNFAKGGIPRL